MKGYYNFAIKASAGVRADALAERLEDSELEQRFKEYMVSPFTTIEEQHGWSFAYTQEDVGCTSGFGHLIDHMAMNRRLSVTSSELIHFTNQKFSKTLDTDLPLTDHNSVKTVFHVK